MKYHDSKRIDEWSWVESSNNNTLRTINDWMDTSKYGQSIELDGESDLRINWEFETPLYLDREGRFDDTTNVTKKGSSTVKKIINIGAEFMVLAEEDGKDRVFFLQRSYLALSI